MNNILDICEHERKAAEFLASFFLGVSSRVVLHLVRYLSFFFHFGLPIITQYDVRVGPYLRCGHCVFLDFASV